MIVSKVDIKQNASTEEVKQQLIALQEHKIDHPNWIYYDSYPEVSFKIAHNSQHIYLLFTVKEDEVRAVAKGNNSDVWNDSCVEFFISLDSSKHYYNLEQSCIGQALMGYRTGKEDAIHADDKTLDSIKRISSLGTQNFELRKGRVEWTLLCIIPISSFWMHNLKSFDGLSAKANFYKCGDELTKPHYLSWSAVEIESPDFHRVDFFKEITFEK